MNDKKFQERMYRMNSNFGYGDIAEFKYVAKDPKNFSGNVIIRRPHMMRNTRKFRVVNNVVHFCGHTSSLNKDWK